MPPMQDMDLLREYSLGKSESSFAELVRRYVNLVHSAALRQVRDPHLAEEITQAVFIVLARNAGRLSAKTILSGWLLRTTRYAANAQIRAAVRRANREQEAYMQSTLNEPQTDTWEQIAPLLDEAMAALGDSDRNAIALRFFENKTAREIAVALNLSEEAAQKRVTRALERLRKIFLNRGVTLTTALIAGAVSANSVQAAPVGLVAAVTTTAAKGTLVSATITTLVKGTMKTMTWLKIKFAAGVGVAALLAGGVATVALSGDGTGGSATSVFQIRAVADAAAPDNEIMTQTTTNSRTGQVVRESLHVQKKVLLDQAALDSVTVTTNEQGWGEVNFTLTPEGTKQFAKATRDNIGRRLAIIVESNVVSAPVVRAELRWGRGMISGQFTEEEARSLAQKISKPAAK